MPGISRALNAAVIATLLGGCVSASSAQFETYTYAEVNGMPLELDFRRQAAGEAAPLIIWIHGGGWAGGSRSFPGILNRFHDDGYAVATISYRLTSQSALWNGAPVTWPAQAHDCKAAVRWLRANAESLNVDPDLFVSWGSSAGGHLSAVLGTSNGHPFLEGDVGDELPISSDVQLAVDYFGPSDLLFMNLDVTDPPGSMIDHDDIRSPESRLLGADVHGFSVGDIRAHLGDPNDPWPGLVQLARTAAPARLAIHEPSNVPMFIAHGQQDTSVPHDQSVRLLDALTAAGTSSVMLSEPDAGHGMPSYVADEVKFWLDGQVAVLRCDGDIADDLGTLNASDGQITFGDFLALLGLIGPCPGGTPGCTGDIADDFGFIGPDGMVSFGDFLALLGLIGPCP